MEGKKLVPQLRFPSYEGEWLVKKLEDITRINQGLQIAISERYTSQIEGSIFYITNEFLKETSDKKFFILNPPKSVVCDVNDVLMTRTGNTGQVVTNVAGAFHNNFFKIKFDKSVDKDFLVYFLRSYKTQNEIIKLAGTSTIPDLNHGDFYKIKILLPYLKEQQKIASFITSVDKRIQTLQKKKSLLAQYKKGMMQKLFSQEIRFKDENENDFLNWEEKKLNDLYSFKSTNSFSRDKLNYEVGTVKNVHYGDIHTKFKTHFDLLKEPVPFINEDIDINRISDENFLKEGDLLVADASEDYADIGKAIEVINLNNEKIVGGLHTFLLRRKDNSIKIGFGGHLLKESHLRLNIKKIAQGTKVLSISTGRLGEIKVRLPSLKEQQKIASFLSAIDVTIEKVSLQVKKTQEFKKGLLQKMFV